MVYFSHKKWIKTLYDFFLKSKGMIFPTLRIWICTSNFHRKSMVGGFNIYGIMGDSSAKNN